MNDSSNSTMLDREAASNTRLFIKRIVFRYIPENIRKGYAKIGGYFWTKCPLCGEAFGGFEVAGGIVTIDESTGRGEGICPSCCVPRTSFIDNIR